MRDETPAPRDAQRWLLLIHQIPPKPDYLRVKVGRRLQRVGAVPVKNSVYVLPDNAQSLEDFQWIRAEIVAGEGEAFICRADFVDGLTDEEIAAMFRQPRAGEFAEIANDAARLLRQLDARTRREHRTDTSADGDELARLRRRFAAVAALDFFQAPEGRRARSALDAVEARLGQRRPVKAALAPARAVSAEYRGRTWVTREGVFVDRIASAWLIRRFIDPDASFRFVPGPRHRARPGELRFDMPQGEFTHEGERCTFEILLERFALDGDAALVAIAEIVHDIDLRDERFGRNEAAGVEFVLKGIVAAHAHDDQRVERGTAVLDDLYVMLAAQ